MGSYEISARKSGPLGPLLLVTQRKRSAIRPQVRCDHRIPDLSVSTHSVCHTLLGDQVRTVKSGSGTADGKAPDVAGVPELRAFEARRMLPVVLAFAGCSGTVK